MRKNWMLAGAAMLSLGLTLGACSEAEDRATYADAALEADFAGETAEIAADDRAIPELGDIPVSLPQLAYTYDYRWALPAADIGPLQRRHASLCEQQGPTSCQILGMSKSGEEASEVTGLLEMAVASRQARAFGALLEDEAQDAGAEQISAEIASEELSRNIVDTEARLRARTELRDRLLGVLRTRKGTVQELVEAERSVARVNEEIDQARSWLKQMEGRVAYSRVTVRYETGVPISSDFLGPVQGALGALGSIFGYATALMILIGATVLPVGLVVWMARALYRRAETQPQPEA